MKRPEREEVQDALTQRVLDLCDSYEAPEPRPGLEGRLWHRLEPQLTEPVRAPRRWRFAAALAAVAVIAFAVGRMGDRGHAVPPEARERILFVAVGDHVDETHRWLTEVMNTRPERGAADLELEKARAASLATDNRLYRATLDPSRDERLIELLEELENVLVEVANGPGRTEATELNSLKRRIEKRGLMLRIELYEPNSNLPEPKRPYGAV